MPTYEFHLAIAPEEFVRVYQGTASVIVVRTTQGLRVQLPAARFRKFVTPEGVHGHFELTTDERNKVVELRRL